MKTHHITVLKLGGELLEDDAALKRIAGAIVCLAATEPLVVVHGGGRAIDAELRMRGQEPRFVDGLRVTDAKALEAVVAVLAGRTNTALVAAIGAAGGRAVGLTGADAAIGLSSRSGTFRTVAGDEVDLGFVGVPDADPGEAAALIDTLLDPGYIPVIASVGVSRTGALLNVNADTLAGHLAAALGARRLMIAGATPGVVDANGGTLARLTIGEIDAMTASGAAHSGMIAKLAACRQALNAGVSDVSIVSGRSVDDFNQAMGTRMEVDLLVTHAQAGTGQANAHNS